MFTFCAFEILRAEDYRGNDGVDAHYAGDEFAFVVRKDTRDGAVVGQNVYLHCQGVCRKDQDDKVHEAVEYSFHGLLFDDDL